MVSSSVRSVVVRLRAEMGAFKKEWDGGTDSVRGTARALEDAKNKSNETEKATDKTGTAVGRLTEKVVNNRQAWDQVGSSFLRQGAALVGLSALVTKAAMDWETAWAGVTKTVDGTDTQMAGLEDDLRSLTKELPATHQEIAAVAEAAGQLGVAREDIALFTRTMVDLSETTDLTADTAATSIAQLTNVMKTAPGDVDNLASALVALGNDGASTESQIIQMAQRIAGAAAVVGLTESNVLALANALASSGIEVEAGGSAISAVLIDIDKAVKTNSASLMTWAEVAGTSAEEFAARWQADPATALADFTEGLGKINEEGGNVFGVLDALGQSDIRVTRALLNMAASGDMLRQSLKLGDQAWEENTALAEEAAKRYDTTAAQASIAWNNIKDNAIDAGQGMLPVISTISDGVIRLADVFGALPGPVQGSLGLIAGVGGVGLVAAGGLMKLVGTAVDLRDAFDQLDASNSVIATGVGKVGRVATATAVALLALKGASMLGEDDNVASVAKYTQALVNLQAGASRAKPELDALFTFDGYRSWLTFGTEVSTGVDGIADAFDRLDENKLETFTRKLTPWKDGFDNATAAFGQLDNALASMAQSGSADEAADLLRKVADQADITGTQLLEQLPQYADVAEGLRQEAAAARDAFREAGEGSDYLTVRLSELGPSAEEAQAALDEMRQQTEDAAMAFFDLSEKISPEELGFQDWIKQLEDMANAQEDWADNLIKATARGVDQGVIEKFEEMGVEGAARLAELADASDEEIARVNEAFVSSTVTASDLSAALDTIPGFILTEFTSLGGEGAVEQAAQLAAEYDLVPTDVQTILEAMDWATEDIDAVMARMIELNQTVAAPTALLDDLATDPLGVLALQLAGVDTTTAAPDAILNDSATGPVTQLGRYLLDLDGQSATVSIEARLTGLASSLAGPGGSQAVLNLFGQQKADGGEIHGVGGPRDDANLVLASKGEHMWTAAEVNAMGGQQEMYQLRARVRSGWRPRFEVGGAVSDAWNHSYRAAAAGLSAPAGGTSVVVQGAPVELGDLVARMDSGQMQDFAHTVGDYVLSASANITDAALAQQGRAQAASRTTRGVNS